jgi:endo-1,4-beta-D-glucanase Y
MSDTWLKKKAAPYVLLSETDDAKLKALVTDIHHFETELEGANEEFDDAIREIVHLEASNGGWADDHDKMVERFNEILAEYMKRG